MDGHGTVNTSTMLCSQLFEALFSTCRDCLFVVSVGQLLCCIGSMTGQWP